MSKQFGSDFKHLAATDHIKTLTLVNSMTGDEHALSNIPGKQASVKIIYNIARDNGFTLTVKEAERGIDLYGDYVQEEIDTPGSHPNIRLLIDTVLNKHEWKITAN